MSHFKFAKDDLKSLTTLHEVKTIRSADGIDSSNKYLLLVDTDGKKIRSVVCILDGNKVGLEISKHFSHDNLLKIPHFDADAKFEFEILYDPIISEQKLCYQVFLGDGKDAGSTMILHSEEALDAATKNQQDFYVMKFEYGKETQVLFNLTMVV
jgi:hypothetical protein